MAEEREEQGSGPASAAVDLVYEIAVDAYASAREQWESVHRRIDTFLSFVTTVTIAAPVAAGAVFEDPDFSSPLLISAGAAYLVVVLLALVARSFGAIQQMSPKELQEQWLHLEEGEFKAGIIDWSGRHNARSRVIIARKHFAANTMALFFVVEALLLIAWIVAAS